MTGQVMPIDAKRIAKRAARKRGEPVEEPPDDDGPGGPAGPDDDGHQRPQIQANERLLEKVAFDITEALEQWNDPPQIFVRGGELVRVRPDEEGRPRIERLTLGMLRLAAARAAAFYTARRRIDEGAVTTVKKACFPPKDAVVAVLEAGAWAFPELRAVTMAPIVRPDGSIVTRHGYDRTTGYYLWVRRELPVVPDTPSDEDLVAAVQILDEATGDFPCETQADRANLWAFLLTPLLRPLLDAVPPMALVDAPQPGTGKGMLVKLMSVIAYGDTPAMTPVPERDEEFAKQLTTFLLQGQPLVVLDNVEKPLKSPTLAAALTSDPYQGRVLGQSSAPPVPNRAIYVATGNNVAVAGDLARRCYRIRLNAAAPNPDRRSGFTHDPLLPWARQHRGELLAALCVLVRSWWLAGQVPDGSAPGMGESTPWVRMVGGILAHVGVAGFLQNADAMRGETDVEEGEWAAFMAAWHAHHALGDQPVTIADLTRELEGQPSLRQVLPATVVSAWDTKSWANTLGNRLRGRLGRFHGPEGWHLKRHGTDRVGRALWSVARYTQG